MDVAWGVVFAQCLFFSAALFCCCACLHYLLTVCEHYLHLPTSPLTHWRERGTEKGVSAQKSEREAERDQSRWSEKR